MTVRLMSWPGVYAPDDFTVVIELEETNVGWHLSATTDLQILPAHIFSNVVPEDIVEHHAPAWYTPELNIGSGPFKLCARRARPVRRA